MATTTDLIQQLYVAYFNRPADVSGLAFWVDAYDNKGVSLDTISKNFNTAAEYTSAYAGLSADAIVNTVYQNLFGRTADSAGLNFWGPKIASKAITTADLVKAISAGALNADGSLNADGLVLANKVSAAGAFTNELAAAGNEAERVAYSTGAAAVLSAAKNFIAGVTDDASLAAATTASNLHSVGQNLVVLTTPTTTTALTTGVDAVKGGAGIDTFNAFPGAGNASTLTSFDSIDGGAGVDTLNVVTIGAYTVPTSASVKNVEIANLTGDNTLSADVSGWTGLTSLTTAAVGGSTIIAASTTAVSATDTNGGVSVSGGSTQTVAAKGGVTLSGATGAIVATDSAQGAVATTIDNGTSVTLTTAGITANTGTITVGGTKAPTGAVTITATAKFAATGTSGAIAVTGGTVDTITQNITSATANAGITVTGGAVGVTGKATTTSVTVNQSAAVTAAAAIAAVTEVKNSAGEVTTAGVTAVGAKSGVVDGAVTIADLNAGSTTAAATISTVSLSNYGNSTISSNALANLTLAGTAGTLGLTSGLTTETVTTLNLTVNGLSGANTITDTSNHFKTINVTTTGADSTIANISDTAATALTVAGTKNVTFTSLAGLTKLAGVTVSGSAGLTADVSGITSVTNVNASATSGANNVTLLSTQTAYQGGSGVDTVTITGVASKVIDGGAGTNDVLVSNTATYATNSKIVNFETLQMGALANGAFDATGFAHLAAGAITGASSFTNVANGADLTITGAAGAAITYGLLNSTGSSDTLVLNLNTAGTSVANSVAAAGVENVIVNLNDTTTTSHLAATETLTLGSTNTAKSLVFNNSTPLKLALTDTDTSLTSVDASNIKGVGAGFSWTAGALTAASTIKGATGGGTNTVVLSAATVKATYIGGSGADTVTIANALANNLTLGDGTNVVNGAASGNNTITGGSGADTFTSATTGNNTVSFGDGANAFTATSGNNTYTGGSGVDTVILGANSAGGQGTNTITTGTGADVITLKGTVVDSAHYSTIVDPHAGETIVLSGTSAVANGTPAALTQITGLNPTTSVFTDWVNAAAAGDGSGTSLATWFQYGGNTYIVVDNAAGTTFWNGVDTVVKLTGLVDLSSTTATTTFGANSVSILLG